MKQIIFETTKELSKTFVNSLPTEYWYKNKIRFFKKEHSCSLLMKDFGTSMKFIIISTHDDFTLFMTNHLESLDIKYEEQVSIEDTEDYEFILSKEIDQQYMRTLNLQLGSSRVELNREKYFSSHIQQFKEKLEIVFGNKSKEDAKIAGITPATLTLIGR